MASWQDLAGGEEVTLGKHKLLVPGIGIDGLKLLALRFPDFVDCVIDGRPDVAVLIRDFPSAVVVALAAGIGEPGNEECEKTLGRLPLHQQFTLLEAIIRQTIGGNDPGPFVEQFKRVMQQMGFNALSQDHPAPSPTNSHAPSSTSESAATPT